MLQTSFPSSPEFLLGSSSENREAFPYHLFCWRGGGVIMGRPSHKITF
jgi:hypothetical protein